MGAASDDDWGDLLLDVGLPPGVDDLRLDCGLGDLAMTTGLDGLDCLGLEFGGATAAAGTPASSDLLESLQIDTGAFVPLSSTGTRPRNSSDSGSDSPAMVPLLGTAPLSAHAAAALPQLAVPAARGGQASPATSESDNNGRGRSESPATASAQGEQQGAAAAVAPRSQKAMTEDEKRQARMQRNRENAQLSRQRKKQQMSELEARCVKMAQQNASLAGTVQRLTAENASLRQQLMLVCQQAGRAPPGAVPAAAPKPGAGGQAAKGPPSAAAASVAGRGILPQWPVLPFGLLPRVALAAQQQQQQPCTAGPGRTAPTKPAAVGQATAAAKPAPAASGQAAAGAKPAQATAATSTQRAAARPVAPAATPAQSRPAPSAPARPAKRAKTAAAGASTAFLALFSLFMFVGPLSPSPITTPSGSGTSAVASIAGVSGGGQRMLQALPEAASAASAAAAVAEGGAGARYTGRHLQALPAATTAPADTLVPQQAARLDLDGGRLQQLLNSTLQALLLEPGNEALEAAALQRLHELGPVALLLDADSGASAAGSNPLSASAAFPQLAGQLFGSAGLEVPRMCRKVLEFDAAAVPHAVRTRRSLERYVLGATGFKGRSLAGGASSSSVAAAPEPQRIEQQARVITTAADSGGDDGGILPSDTEESRVLGSRLDGAASTALLPRADEQQGPVLVSVLLPANASGGAELSAVDKVFVVLLHPQEKYGVYSCALPRPVFL